MQNTHRPYGPRPPTAEDVGGSAGRRLFLLLVLAGLAAGGYWWFRTHAETRPAGPAPRSVFTASDGRLTLEDDDGGHLSVVSRRSAPDVYYRVRLSDAPAGQRLALSCEWVDPRGRVVHRNQYQTRPITKSPWSTHAHYRFGPGDMAGEWTVRLAHDGRTLIQTQFDVADGDGASTTTAPATQDASPGGGGVRPQAADREAL